MTASDQPKTTSLVVAEAFGKEHKNVLQALENLECSNDFRELNFKRTVESLKIGVAVREQPYYTMTRDGFAFLVMGFTGKKAAEWKEKFIAAFNAMEAGLKATGFNPALVTNAIEAAMKPVNEQMTALTNALHDLAKRQIDSSLDIQTEVAKLKIKSEAVEKKNDNLHKRVDQNVKQCADMKGDLTRALSDYREALRKRRQTLETKPKEEQINAVSGMIQGMSSGKLSDAMIRHETYSAYARQFGVDPRLVYATAGYKNPWDYMKGEGLLDHFYSCMVTRFCPEMSLRLMIV